MAAARKVFSLNERHEGIKLMDLGLSVGAFVVKFNVRKAQVTNRLKRQAKIIKIGTNQLLN